MKKILTVIMLCITAGAVSCGTNVQRETADVTVPATAEPSVTQELSATPEPEAGALLAEKLPKGCNYEKMKEALLEELNYKAWFHPFEMPQTAYECTYEVYLEPQKEGFKAGFCCLAVSGEKWYDCVLDTGAASFDGTNRSGEYRVSESRRIDKMTQYLGKDTILVPAVTKPEFEMTAEKEETIEIIKNGAIKIYHECLEKFGWYKKEGKTLKIELIISDYIPEFGGPYVYLIINDEDVDFCDLSGISASEYVWSFVHSYCRKKFQDKGYGMFIYKAPSSLASIDKAQFERIKEDALLDYVYEGEDSDSMRE